MTLLSFAAHRTSARAHQAPERPSSPRQAFSSARRSVAIGSLALATTLLCGCSSDVDPSAPPVAGSTSAPAGATSGGDLTQATIAANGDPFCSLAAEAQSQARALDTTTSEFQVIMTNVTSGAAPLADLHEWGATLGEIATSSLGFYDAAAPYVAGTDAEGSFEATRQFVAVYSLPLAQVARDATDSATFLSSARALIDSPEVQSVVATGPTAADEVAAYIADRCPTA